MDIRVKVVANARKESVEEGKDGRLTILLRAPRKDGKANMRLIEILAEYFAVPVSRVRIVRGQQLSSKIVSIYRDTGS
jgi:uncharacterized protein (TIGR00251 family)